MPLRGAVHVAVVHMRAGLPGRPDDLFRAVDQGIRRQLGQVPGVREGRHPGGRGQPGDLEVLVGADARRVAEQDADTQGPVGQVGGQAGQHRAQLPGRGRALPGRVADAGQERGQASRQRQPGYRFHPR